MSEGRKEGRAIPDPKTKSATIKCEQTDKGQGQRDHESAAECKGAEDEETLIGSTESRVAGECE